MFGAVARARATDIPADVVFAIARDATRRSREEFLHRRSHIEYPRETCGMYPGFNLPWTQPKRVLSLLLGSKHRCFGAVVSHGDGSNIGTGPGPVIKDDRHHPLVGTNGAQLALKKSQKSGLMCRYDNLPMSAETPQHVDQSQEVDGVQTLERIVEHG